MEFLIDGPRSFGWEFIKGGLSILSLCLWKPKPHFSRTQKPFSKVTRLMSLTLCGRAASQFRSSPPPDEHSWPQLSYTTQLSVLCVSHKASMLPLPPVVFRDWLKMTLNSLCSRGWLAPNSHVFCFDPPLQCSKHVSSYPTTYLTLIDFKKKNDIVLGMVTHASNPKT